MVQDISPFAEVIAEKVFRVYMMDFSGGGITKNYTADESSMHADPSKCEFLTHHLQVHVV
ncbi:hypothetical protein Lalb_Chr05g0225981 [Lupinus albus]|uniref:Uncharacterized protein n=1 Tax=Lupinus albus TaxID=3870 RepID=A0A6A4QKL7_LUPAL|nr:hypothetical protein Lalb_Chr05g0225981 [Lupinus albus]